MADQRQIYKWGFVGPGDIISFRYKTERTKQTRIHTVLVLNPRLLLPLKEGSPKRMIAGIKLEENNKITGDYGLRITRKQLFFLQKIGDLQVVNKEKGLYKLSIDSRHVVNEIKGVKKRAYDLITKSAAIKNQYRTYDYYKARRSAVYVEPIRVFTQIED